MGTNVHLTPDLERFARERVSEGRYNNVSEVVREALRLLQDQEQTRRGAEAARIEADQADRSERERRELAFKALMRRLEGQPTQNIGPWTRDELYD